MSDIYAKKLTAIFPYTRPEGKCLEKRLQNA